MYYNKNRATALIESGKLKIENDYLIIAAQSVEINAGEGFGWVEKKYPGQLKMES